MFLKLTRTAVLSLKNFFTYILHTIRFRLHKILLYAKIVVMWEFFAYNIKECCTYPDIDDRVRFTYLDYSAYPEIDIETTSGFELWSDYGMEINSKRCLEGSTEPILFPTLSRFFFMAREVKHEFWPFFLQKVLFILNRTGCLV